MNTDLRKHILDFLTPLPCLSTEDARRATLYAAGLDTILHQTNLSGSPTNAIATILYTLDQHGTVNDEPAVVVFLHQVAATVGSDKQEQIQAWCKQLRHAPPSPTPQASPSTTQSDASGPNSGIQIGSVAGNVQVAQVQGDVQGDIVGRDKKVSHQKDTTHITTQGEYFEHVKGQAQVFTGPVTINQGTASNESAPTPESDDQPEKQFQWANRSSQQSSFQQWCRKRKVVLLVGLIGILLLGAMSLYMEFSSTPPPPGDLQPFVWEQSEWNQSHWQ